MAMGKLSASGISQLLKANKPAFGFWLTMPGAPYARHAALAHPAISWILVDCEHGLIPLQGSPGAFDTISAISAASAAGSVQSPSAIVRVPATGNATGVGWQIKVALDAGAAGVLVPMVGSKQEAEEVATWSRFPPVGKRGLGSPVAHHLWGCTQLTYLAEFNDQATIMIQIETIAGVENLEEIASVPGIDVLFVGPFDLSLALGYPVPNPDPHPEVEVVIQKVLQAGKRHGKAVGIYCSNGEQGAERARQGFTIISIQSDVSALHAGLAKEFKAATGVVEDVPAAGGY